MDAQLTKVLGGTLVKVCAWYDNEWGFSNRMLDTTLAWSRAAEMKRSGWRISDLAGKRVLIREDLNVPIEGGRVTSDARIRAALPTLRLAIETGRARDGDVASRPPEGRASAIPRCRSRRSRTPVRAARSEARLRFIDGELDDVNAAPGEVALLENVRFNKGEKMDDDALAKRMAALCDVFVMDAFGTAHRAEASTHGVALQAPVACAGPLLAGELDALERAMREPARPLVAVVGGSKVSTKLSVLENLLAKVDQLVVGGGIANTFLAATGLSVGKSLHEPDMIGVASAFSRARRRAASAFRSRPTSWSASNSRRRQAHRSGLPVRSGKTK